jgi:hypothetical protein
VKRPSREWNSDGGGRGKDEVDSDGEDERKKIVNLTKKRKKILS